MGLCRGRVSEDQYREIIEEAVEFLRSGRLDSVQELTQKMNEAAEKLEFEKAAKYRDRLRSMQKITEKQKVINSRIPEQDIFGFVQNGDKIGVAVLKFRHSTLVDKEDFVLEAGSPLALVRGEFLTQYYGGSADIPPYVALDEDAEDRQLVEDFLTRQRGKRVRLFVPQRGGQQKLVQMAVTNAAERLSLEIQRTGREVAALDELGRLLGLVSPPQTTLRPMIFPILQETIL